MVPACVRAVDWSVTMLTEENLRDDGVENYLQLMPAVFFSRTCMPLSLSHLRAWR